MKLVASRDANAAEWSLARARLLDVAGWADWFPGLRTVVCTGAATWLTFADAHRSRIRIGLDPHDQSVHLHMVQGDVRSLDASIEWSDDTVTLCIQLDVARPLPGSLARELEQVYPARWLTALFAEPASAPSSF